MYEYLIIGAGMSGVSFARLLQMTGECNFVILEAENEAGGLCRSKRVGDHILDTGGGHFLCSKFKEVYDFLFAHFPVEELNHFPRISKVRILGHEIDYPVENNLWQLPAELRDDFVTSVVESGESLGEPPPETFSDWVRWRLGARIADTYMIPYNEKIWGIPLEEMATDWLHKLPRLDAAEIVSSCRSGRALNGKMPSHEGFYYPKKGGFQAIFDAVLGKLPAGAVRLSEPAVSLVNNGDHWLVNERYRARKVINTAPWTSLRDALTLPEPVRDNLEALRHNQLVVSLYETPYTTPSHWIYEPAPEVRHHREFMIANFAESSAPGGMYTETNYRRWQSNADSLYEHINSFAYPIPTKGRAKAIAGVLEWGEQLRLFGLGRWGQWDYLNADVCIREAMLLLSKVREV
jgi:protoporphyrinogen oxidase